MLGCNFGSSAPSRPPPPTAEHTQVATVEVEVRNFVVIELNEIRLTERAVLHDVDINVDSVFMVPLDVESVGMGARFQYVEDDTVNISANSPYNPTSRWTLAIERRDLNNEDFGIWFMVTGRGDMGPSIRRELTGFTQDLATFFTAGVATTVLTAGRAPAAVASARYSATRGKAVIGRLSALTTAGGFVLRNTLESIRMPTAIGGTERLAGLLSEYATLLDGVGYFGEAYITFQAEDDYRLNNRIAVVTTDGSLVLEFSIFETANANIFDESLEAVEIVEDYFPSEECNPNAPSRLLSGQPARVVVSSLNVSSSPIASVSELVARLPNGANFTPLIPFCDQNENILWWRIRMENGEHGWLQESRGTIIHVELVS